MEFDCKAQGENGNNAGGIDHKSRAFHSERGEMESNEGQEDYTKRSGQRTDLRMPESLRREI